MYEDGRKRVTCWHNWKMVAVHAVLKGVMGWKHFTKLSWKEKEAWRIGQAVLCCNTNKATPTCTLYMYMYIYR